MAILFPPCTSNSTKVVDAVGEHSDTVAERMRALQAVPDGRTRTIANTTRLTSFPEGEVSVERAVAVVAERINAVVNIIRAVHDDVDEQDPTSADILHTTLESLEKQRWMLASQLRTLQTSAGRRRPAAHYCNEASSALRAALPSRSRVCVELRYANSLTVVSIGMRDGRETAGHRTQLVRLTVSGSALFITVFLACLVEAVEALTIILAAGTCA